MHAASVNRIEEIYVSIPKFFKPTWTAPTFLVLRTGISIHTPGDSLFKERGFYAHSMDSFFVEQSIRMPPFFPKDKH